MKSECFIMPDQWQTVTPLYYGFEACRSGHSSGLVSCDHYMVHFVFEGCGTIEQNGKNCNAGKNDIFILGPSDTLCSYTADKETPWTYAWVGFKADGSLPGLSDTVMQMPSAHSIFSSLREEDIPIHQLYSLIHDLLQLLGQGKPASVSRNYAENAKVYLSSNLRNVSIENIAKALHIDRRYLTAVFRKAYGLTPQQYLMELRLKKAKELLCLGYSVSDTAAMSGFSNLSNFSKKYKQYYGITPMQQKQASVRADTDA